MSAGRNPEKFFERYAPFFAAVDKYADQIQNVLVIGANDGQLADPVGQCWREHWFGGFVEPDPETGARLLRFLEKEKRKSRWIQDACGTEDFTRPLKLYRLIRFAALRYKEVTGDDGSALTSFDYKHIADRIKKHLPGLVQEYGMSFLIQDIDVNVYVPSYLLDVFSPQLVQVDVEGMDYEIVEEILQYDEKLPLIILFEHQHLTAQQCTVLDALAAQKGYRRTHMRNDTMYVRDLEA